MKTEKILIEKRKLIESHIGHETFEKVLADLDKNRKTVFLLPVVIEDIASYYRLANQLPDENNSRKIALRFDTHKANRKFSFKLINENNLSILSLILALIALVLLLL